MAGLGSYTLTTEETNEILIGTADTDYDVQNMLITSMSGVEGMPYQFLESVDRRIDGTTVGRKYTEKIISRIPLLFLTPCEPVFMDDFGDMDKSTVAEFLVGATKDVSSDLINGKGRYYSVEFAYADYYKYLNTMLSSLAAFMGISDKQIKINGERKKLKTMNWQYEIPDSFKSFFSSSENVVFYLDGLSQVSESYGNSTTESSLASQINGYSEQANEIKFLFGSKGSLLGNIIDSTEDIATSISSGLSSVMGNLGGGIVESICSDGVDTILNGGKIIFPEIWNGSEYDRSYSIDIKLRSPDHDSLSIFLNVLKPYCKILALTLPRMQGSDPNGYRSPFLVKAYCKGLFNIDMGLITSLSVTRGAECCWNDDGLPTQIDISLEIKDLYSSLVMGAIGTDADNNERISAKDIVCNTSYMDFLANMAGLNLAQMELGRRIKMYFYLTSVNFETTPSRLFTRFDQAISNIIGRIYNTI